MMYYRSQNLVEAVQLSNDTDALARAMKMTGTIITVRTLKLNGNLIVDTPAGRIIANFGDWIVSEEGQILVYTDEVFKILFNIDMKMPRPPTKTMKKIKSDISLVLDKLDTEFTDIPDIKGLSMPQIKEKHAIYWVKMKLEELV